jgi:hypothetical protein
MRLTDYRLGVGVRVLAWANRSRALKQVSSAGRLRRGHEVLARGPIRPARGQVFRFRELLSIGCAFCEKATPQCGERGRSLQASLTLRGSSGRPAVVQPTRRPHARHSIT